MPWGMLLTRPSRRTEGFGPGAPAEADPESRRRLTGHGAWPPIPSSLGTDRTSGGAPGRGGLPGRTVHHQGRDRGRRRTPDRSPGWLLLPPPISWLLKGGPEQAPGSKESGHHGAQRNLKNLRHFSVGKAPDMGQDDHLAVGQRQSQGGLPNLLDQALLQGRGAHLYGTEHVCRESELLQVLEAHRDRLSGLAFRPTQE